jgi:hypothetical protein
MLSRRHPDARCPWCGEPLWFGLKSEPTGWKVQYDCAGPEGCGRELSPGRISVSEVATDDEAVERAAALGSALY